MLLGTGYLFLSQSSVLQYDVVVVAAPLQFFQNYINSVRDLGSTTRIANLSFRLRQSYTLVFLEVYLLFLQVMYYHNTRIWWYYAVQSLHIIPIALCTHKNDLALTSKSIIFSPQFSAGIMQVSVITISQHFLLCLCKQNSLNARPLVAM